MKSNVVAVIVLVLLGCIAAALQSNESKELEWTPPSKGEPVSVEKVGEAAGRTTRKFGRGFVRGWKAEMPAAEFEEEHTKR